MEEAAGQRLEDIWERLELESRASIVQDLVLIEKKLLAISFERFVTR